MTLMHFYILISTLKTLLSVNCTNIKWIVIEIRYILLNYRKLGNNSDQPTLKKYMDFVDRYIVSEYYLSDWVNVYVWNDKIMITYRDWIIYLHDRDELEIFDKAKLYKKWDNAKTRCYRGSSKSNKKNYQDRGIAVCDDWRYSSEYFIIWSVFFGDYHESSVIDRIDNDGDYEPDNVRFVSVLESLNNKRNTIRLVVDGETQTLSEWGRRTGIAYQKLYDLYKRDPDAAKEKIRSTLKDRIDDASKD